MISTLKKFPWHMTGYITVKERHMVYDACRRLARHLTYVLKDEKSKIVGVERLTPRLFRRFTNAILLCPGFTVVQKDDVASLAEMADNELFQFNMPRVASSWTHLYALGPKPNVALDVLEVRHVMTPDTCDARRVVRTDMPTHSITLP